jgi:hypothetical protein
LENVSSILHLLGFKSFHSPITFRKIMNKFIAIAAATGLVAAFAGTAQAQTTLNSTVISTAFIPTTCNITGQTPGLLTINAAKTQLATTAANRGKVSVICNTGSSKLQINAPVGFYEASGPISSTTPANSLPPSHIPGASFANGTGIYTGATGTSVTATSSTSGTTADDAFVNTVINASPGQIQAGNYAVNVPIVLTP